MWNLPPVVAHIVELVILLALSGVALGVGLRLLNILALSSILRRGERLLFGIAIGYGALAFSMLTIGLLGVLYLPVGLIVLALLALAGYSPLMSEIRLARPALKNALSSLQYPPNTFLALVILLALAVAITKALVPVATQDDLMYHLALPRRYVDAHSIGFYPDSTYSLFPQLMEMLYTWGLLLGSDRLPVLLAVSVGLIGPAAIALFARRYLCNNSIGLWRALPLLAAALYVTTPLVGYVLRAANTDLAQASFDMLAVYAFVIWVSNSDTQRSDDGKQARTALDPRPLVLAGMCCSLAFSVKYYGFAMAVVLGLALASVLVYRYRRIRPVRSVKPSDDVVQTTRPLSTLGRFRRWQTAPSFLLLYFTLPVFDLAVPWLLRNIVASGNPVWPLAGSLLGGAYWSPQSSPETLLGVAPTFNITNIWTGLQSLWTAYTRDPLVIDNQQHVVNLGTLLLPSLLTLLFARWKPALKWLLYAAGAYWLIWAFFFSRTSLRYLSTFFLLAALLGAYGLVSMAVRYRPLRPLITGIVGVALGFLAVQSVLSAGTYLPTVLSFDGGAETQYLRQYMDDYPVMKYIGENTPANATIYVWDGQPRGYYIPRNYVYARLVPLYTGFGDEPAKWRTRLAELGVTHILVHNRRILAPGQPIDYDPQAQAEQRFAAQYFGTLLFRVGDYVLYALR